MRITARSMKRSAVFCLAGSASLALAGCAEPASTSRLATLRPMISNVEAARLRSEEGAATSAAAPRWFTLTAAHPPTIARTDNAAELFGPTQSAQASARTGADADQSSGDSPPGRRVAPLPGFWDTLRRDVKQMPGELWEDTKAVYTSVPNLVVLGATYGGALAIQETGPDDTVEDSFAGGHQTFSDDWRDAFGAAGNPGTHFALAGLWYLVGQQTQNEKTYEVGKTLFSALIINGMSTMAGKFASWDDSPNGEWGAFPSGHTSSSFAFASVMDRAYGPWAGVPLYALGGLVAYERLESGEHYLSDVVMGGVMGLVIGHTVAGEHEFELFGGEIVPYVDPYTGSSGLAWVTHFK